MSNVKDFITIEDAKMTVEKPVKPKPSLSELVKVEKPGKPMPALEVIGNGKKKSKTKKAISKTSKSKTKPAKIENKPKKPKAFPTNSYTLIITEKPQAAQKIASALGDTKKTSEGKVSYFEVSHNTKKIIVASAVGHLMNLTYVKGQKGYPIFNIVWEPSFNKKQSAFTKAYYNVLKKLAAKASDVIIATDFDIEGEVIGWNVLRFICGRETAKRMKYSTLTKPELLKSYESPLPELAWGQAYAGEARHIIDWLYGINLSRALMAAIKSQGSFKLLSIGRVQGPALKVIVDREREIQNFKPETYWQVFASVDDLKLKHPKDIFDKKELDKFKDISSGVAETKDKIDTLQPLHPFDLTSLQKEAYRLHRLSPSQTLRVAQALYLDGIISYPRTSSQKIPDSIEPKKIISELSRHFPEAAIAKRPIPIEGKKSDPAHPSIYPTGEFKELKDDELKLYNLIVKRFLACFSPDAKIANRRISLAADKNPEIKFTLSGNKIIEEGWLSTYPYKIEESDLPRLEGKTKIDKIEFEEKLTQPPPRFTPTSLISLLEKKNLGTKATRSMIVDTLFDRGYLDGRSIEATPLGIKLIEALEKHSPIIIDEELTRSLEQEMEKILEATSDFKQKEDSVVEKAKKTIDKISNEFKTKEKEIGSEILGAIQEQREQQKEQNELMPCPVCKQGTLRITYSKKTSRYFVSCNKYPDCKATYSLPPNALIKNTDKKSERGFPMLLALRKGKRPWEFEFNPNWKAEQETNK